MSAKDPQPNVLAGAVWRGLGLGLLFTLTEAAKNLPDRLDLMGHDRRTFPWLTELARGGATFERALAAAPWTLPSHASMFTGVYPSAHGAHHEHPSLDATRTTLAEAFWNAGWETVALSSNPSRTTW